MDAATARNLQSAAPSPTTRGDSTLAESYAAEVMRIIAKCKTACATLANPDKNWTVYELGITAIKLIAGPNACHQCEAAKAESFLSWATTELEMATAAPSISR